MMRTALTCALLLAAAACGGTQEATGPTRTDTHFRCKDRSVEYVVAGGFAADKLGVSVSCNESSARLRKWRMIDGEEKGSTHPLSIGEFEALWEKIESTGWQQLSSCVEMGPPEEGTPVYAFHISDHRDDVKLTCHGKNLPFPYDRLVNELDLKAAGFE